MLEYVLNGVLLVILCTMYFYVASHKEEFEKLEKECKTKLGK